MDVCVFGWASDPVPISALTQEEQLGGYALAVVSGLVIGACCAFGMWKLGKMVWIRTSKLGPDSGQLWYFRALYFSAILWIFLAAVLGKWITVGLLRLVI